MLLNCSTAQTQTNIVTQNVKKNLKLPHSVVNINAKETSAFRELERHKFDLDAANWDSKNRKAGY